MKLMHQTVQTIEGPVVIHWIILNPKTLIGIGESIFPVVANAPNTNKQMEQIAASFRRIKNVSLNGIRGQETDDAVFVISRNKKTLNVWEQIQSNGKTILSADAIEFTVIAQLIQEQRLWVHKGYTRWFEVSPIKHSHEPEIVSRLSAQRRLHYSVPKNGIPSSEISKGHSEQVMMYQDGWIPVKPTLLPIGYTNSFATLPELCDKYQAVAGINAGYFLNMPEELDSIHGIMNDPVGLLMIDGQILIPPVFTRSALLINHRGEVFIQRIGMKDIEIRIGNYQLESPLIYTRASGTTTPPDKTKIELVITNQEVVEINEEPPTLIPQNGFVVSGEKKNPIIQQILDRIRESRVVQYRLDVPASFGIILNGIAAGPQLVDHGRTIPPYFFEREPLQEEFKSMVLAPTRFTHTITDEKSRAPRSAVGVTRDNKVLLVTIDDDRNGNVGGRKRYSIGVTLGELAKILIDLGCVNALNFDGGGSTTLFYHGKIVNRPSDGFPRVISTAILVK